MREFGFSLLLVLGWAVPTAASAADLILVDEPVQAVADEAPSSLRLPAPSGRTGSVVLVDRATLPSQVRERWWDRLSGMAKEGGFGRMGRVIIEDRDPGGGPSVCDEASIAPYTNEDAQVVLCTEMSLSARGEGLAVLVGRARERSDAPWQTARRSVPVVDFGFDEAFAALADGFFVRMGPSATGTATPERPRKPAVSEAQTKGNPRAATSPSAATAKGSPGAEPAGSSGSGEASDSQGTPPSVTAMFLVTALADDTFQVSGEFGLSGTVSLVATAGSQSNTLSGVELGAVLLGGAARAYLEEPMQGLYGSVGLLNVNATLSSKYSEVSSSFTLLQPAVGVKFTGTPGLAVSAEVGVNIAISGETSLTDGDSVSSSTPRGASAGYFDVGLGFSF